MIGADVQNTTRPDMKGAKAIPAEQKRAMLKALVKDRVMKKMVPHG